MPTSIWIAELVISDKTAEKISSKHGISEVEAQDALVCQKRLMFTVDTDGNGKERAIVETKIGIRKVVAVLYPIDSDLGSWALASIYPR